MKHLKLLLCVGVSTMGLTVAGAACADDQATTPPPAGGAATTTPAPTPAAYPLMGPTIAANPNPVTLDAGPLGKVIVSGVLSADAYVQDNPGINFWDFSTNKEGAVDFTNALVTVQKDDGPIQFVIQAGAYSFPALGAPYIKASEQPQATFGYVPVGYVKLVPNSEWSFEVGQLPTLVGAELPFTYENANIERGLLWNQEPLISRGVQVNWSKGPWALSFSVNDGYYSNEYTTLSGAATYTFKNSDTLEFVGSGNTSLSFKNCGPFCAPFATPVLQQEGMIFDVIYSHTQGPWQFTPYFQYNSTPSIGGPGSGFPSQNIWAGAIVGKYSFNANWSIAARAEFEGSNGGNPGEFASLLYGPGSDAYSFTITPTFTQGIFFARAEFSYTGITSGTPGFELGSTFDKTEQVRGFLEAGFNF